ncbi:MAG: hypothetical protein IKK91_01645 [Ruminococcus sp.]|nr:hypothetical protein [Ruminococcus sp.]
MGMNQQLSCSNTNFTANIFYWLLCDAIKNKRAPGDNCNGDTKKLTQTHLFYDLNVLIDAAAGSLGKFKFLLCGGNLQGGQKNAASKFKYGKYVTKKGDIYRFNNTQVKIKFDQQVKSEYSKAFKKAVEFARRYFDDSESARNDALVQKVLYLINSDDSISNTQPFYICSDGSTKTKDELRTIDTIEFEAFLLGVWHYLIVSQKLQSDLKGVNDISVDEKYIRIKFKLIYHDLQKEQVDGAVSANPDDEEKNNKNTNSIKNKAIIYSEPEEIVPDVDPDCYPAELDMDTDFISVLENNDIRLSRAIFFYLLARSIQTIHPKRGKHAIEKLFLALLNLTADNNCSIDLGRSCVRDEHDYFKYLKELSSADCLDDATVVNAFSDKLNTNYDEALLDMINIRKKYFNSKYLNEALVVELIEFIRNDSSIEDNQKFIVYSDGSTLTKAELCDEEELEFEPFLLGVWHYVVSQLDSKDSADEHTFDTVFKVIHICNGKKYVTYRFGDIINEQSERFIELFYLK